MESGEKEYLLYLPFFSEIKSLKIGIDSAAYIKALPNPFRRKIVVYGTSIVHGVAASRPGLNYPSRLARMTGLDFVNLGFSGNARMENELADYLAGVDADAYIIDCVANTTAAQLTERTAYMVRAIRGKRPNVPVILVQSIHMDTGNFKPATRDDILLKNTILKDEYLKLVQQGVKDLYFIEGDELLGHDNEATCDGIHPNDAGFERMATYLKKHILTILEESGIN
jgi:lysophospholipase L1-like esterase